MIFARPPMPSPHPRQIANWLFAIAVLVFAMVVVGGITRLTESGLSITQWRPVSGAVPPLSHEDWVKEFTLYQSTTEYQTVNRTMTLAEFKFIYFWEYIHRLLGRVIGLAFALPFAWFAWKRAIPQGYGWRLGALLALGGLQGAIGWWMVASGLAERVDVSQYRLATHLTVACLIFAATTWVWRALCPHSGRPIPGTDASRFAALMTVVVMIQIYLGALVAGMDAGLAYNTWPLMDGAIVPDGLTVMQPLWLNAFENAKAVQWLHRMNAYLLLALALIQMVMLLVNHRGTTHANRGVVFFLLACAQAAIGIATLLMSVPLDVALTHQGLALVLLGFSVAHWRGFHGEYARPTDVTVRS